MLFSYTQKRFSRKQGHNLAAKLSYRTGFAIKCERTDQTKYCGRNKSKNDIISTRIVHANGSYDATPDDIYEIVTAVDKKEKRKDSVIGREIFFALPHELTDEQCIALSDEVYSYIAEVTGCLCIPSIHDEDKSPAPDGNGTEGNGNIHVHGTIIPREYDPTTKKFGKKLPLFDAQTGGRALNDVIRYKIEDITRKHIELAGITPDDDFTCISLKERTSDESITEAYSKIQASFDKLKIDEEIKPWLHCKTIEGLEASKHHGGVESIKKENEIIKERNRLRVDIHSNEQLIIHLDNEQTIIEENEYNNKKAKEFEQFISKLEDSTIYKEPKKKNPALEKTKDNVEETLIQKLNRTLPPPPKPLLKQKTTTELLQEAADECTVTYTKYVDDVQILNNKYKMGNYGIDVTPEYAAIRKPAIDTYDKHRDVLDKSDSPLKSKILGFLDFQYNKLRDKDDTTTKKPSVIDKIVRGFNALLPSNDGSVGRKISKNKNREKNSDVDI